MCGVIGVSLSNATEKDIELVERIFKETMIRGKHATGLSYVKNGNIYTTKTGIPVDEFLKLHSISEFVNEDGGLYLIGHIRYSTSDLRYNQPFSNGDLSIAHNGVISQEDPSTWEYKTETANDSELILRCLEQGEHPLQQYADRSMSVVTIDKDKKLSCFRNHERPLWITARENGMIFTSTKDIAIRSGMLVPHKTMPFTIYTYDNETLFTEKVKNDFQDLQ